MEIQNVDTSSLNLFTGGQTKASAEGTGKNLANGTSQQDQNPQVLEEAVGKANQIMETYNTELRFSIHQASGEVQVKVINTKDNSVLREIPPTQVLDFVADVKKMLGVIIDKFI